MQICASPGLFIAPFEDRAVVFDAVAQQSHIVSPFAAWLLGFDDAIEFDALLELVADVLDNSQEEATGDLTAHVEALEAMGLLNRNAVPETVTPLVPTITTPETDWTVGRLHGILDRRLAFCGPNAELIASVDAFFGDADPALGPEVRPTDYVGIIPDETGAIDVIDDTEWHFSTEDQLLWQLPSIINYTVSHASTMVVLHAGAVRTPEGKLVVVTGSIDTGKSTLIGALVSGGCDYLGDESIGIAPNDLAVYSYPKPLTLDPESQTIIGVDPIGQRFTPTEHRRAREICTEVRSPVGRIGPIDLIVHTCYRPDDVAERVRLSGDETLKTLLLNTLNLVYAGQSGLETLARVAERVPIIRVVHDDSLALARGIISGAV